jgi:hypothetical protein
LVEETGENHRPVTSHWHMERHSCLMWTNSLYNNCCNKTIDKILYNCVNHWRRK